MNLQFAIRFHLVAPRQPIVVFRAQAVNQVTFKVYQSHYGLAVVIAYLAAYAAGAAAYSMAWRSGLTAIGSIGVLVCAVGFASYSFELTHWLFGHANSLIASAPIALLALAPAAAIQEYRRHKTAQTAKIANSRG
ncbi:MAG: hypothetical protein HY290_19700 [Planctomycetia bacterium]|nr:hypothetical protein [Planctomycetia bacterium]